MMKVIVAIFLIINLALLIWAHLKIKSRLKEINLQHSNLLLLRNQYSQKLAEVEFRNRTVKLREKKLDKLKRKLKEREIYFSNRAKKITSTLRQLQSTHEQKKNEIYSLKIAFLRLKENLTIEIKRMNDELDFKLITFKKELDVLRSAEQQFSEEKNIIDSIIKLTYTDIKLRENQILKTDQELNSVLESIENIRNEIKKDIKRAFQNINRSELRICQREEGLKKQENEIENKRNEIENREKKIQNQNVILLAIKKELENRSEELNHRETELDALREVLKQKEDELTKREKQGVDISADESTQSNGSDNTKNLSPYSPVLIKRGGKPRSTTPTNTEENKPEAIDFPHYFLRCWLSGIKWQVGIEIDSTKIDTADLQIRQEDKNIKCHDLTENRFYLVSLSSTIQVIFNSQEKKKKIDLPLIFKLYNTQDSGRQVTKLSKGSYLVVTPLDWKWDTNSDAQLLSESEQCVLADYKLFLLDFDKNDDYRVSFISPEGKIHLETDSPRFNLVGNQILDANDENAPLFGESLPQLKDTSSRNWEGVREIIIGEEGKGFKRKRWKVDANYKSDGFDLPKEIENSARTWFFVRIYSPNGELIDSFDFRYFKEMTKIEIAKHPPLPSKGGHKPVMVTFHHTKNSTVKLLGDAEIPTEIKRIDSNTIFQIPNQPKWDSTRWEVSFEKKKIEVEVLVERLWWYLYDEEGNRVLTLWKSAPIEVDRPYELFRATSSKCLCIKLPKKRWTNSLWIGFEKTAKREFKVMKNRRDVLIPLREFDGASQLIKFKKDIPLYCWLNLDSTEYEFKVLIVKSKVSPISPPLIPPDSNHRPSCNNCDHARRFRNQSWCRRYNWPQQYSIEDFNEKIAGYSCGEWRGEYWDNLGSYHDESQIENEKF